MLAALVGCGPDYSPNTYSTAAVQQANKVDQGVVAGFREVAIRADGTVGAVTGGAAGGVLGAQTPDGGVVTALSAIGGTLIGGLVGTSVEHAAGDTKAFEYIVRKANGELISVTQKDQTPLAVGLKVLVIEGKQARIVADYSVPLEIPAPAAAASTTANTDSKSARSNATDTISTDKAPSDKAPADQSAGGVAVTNAPSGPGPAAAEAPQAAATPAPPGPPAPAADPQRPRADQDGAAAPAAPADAPDSGEPSPP